VQPEDAADGACTHPVYFRGMCAVCGAREDAESTQAEGFVRTDPGMKISRKEAKRTHDEHAKQLAEKRKLWLLVDLDQTLLHTTMDPRYLAPASKRLPHLTHTPVLPAAAGRSRIVGSTTHAARIASVVGDTTADVRQRRSLDSHCCDVSACARIRATLSSGRA
jgi:hypothetical protein